MEAALVKQRDRQTAEACAKGLNQHVLQFEKFLEGLGKSPALDVARCKIVEAQMWALRHIDGTSS